MNDTADLDLANVQKGRIELSILIGFHDIWFFCRCEEEFGLTLVLPLGISPSSQFFWKKNPNKQHFFNIDILVLTEIFCCFIMVRLKTFSSQRKYQVLSFLISCFILCLDWSEEVI